MTTQLLNYTSGDQLSARPFLTWRIVQSAVWLVGTSHFNMFSNHTCYLCNDVVGHSARE
jgi:hypothetical protein